ncbi:hypothetical protein Tco_0336864 [Tanacetum coccineum]
MITYLKNMERLKAQRLKSKAFGIFVGLGEKTAKVDDDQEAAKIKKLMEIIPDEEEVAIDAIPLATKPPTIFDWKIHKEGLEILLTRSTELERSSKDELRSALAIRSVMAFKTVIFVEGMVRDRTVGLEMVVTQIVLLRYESVNTTYLPPASSVATRKQDELPLSIGLDFRARLDDGQMYSLATGRLIDGSSCDGIDMVIKNLDLEPKIDAI